MTKQQKSILNNLINQIVIANNEPVLDDDYPDVLSDYKNRTEAITTIIEYLEGELE